MFALQFTLVIIAVVAVGSHQHEAREIVKSQALFSNDIYKEISRSTDGNVVSSPLNAYMLLMMIAIGSQGRTSQQIQKAVHFPNTTPKKLQNYIQSFHNIKHANLSLAYTIAVGQEYKLNSDYELLVSKLFNTKILSIDFNDPDSAVNALNEWCTENTNGKIEQILSKQDISDTTQLVLLNALYLKATWKVQFDKDLTEDGSFCVDSQREVHVPMMRMKQWFETGVLERLDAKFIVLPYKNRDLKMTIYVPNKVNGLNLLEENLEELSEVRHHQKSRDYVNLTVPKFKIESSLNLNEIFKNMGMTYMFTDRARFVIAQNPIKVQNVVHKAYIEVNEAGTEAAAITAGVFESRMLIENVVDFKIDRPFYYTITYADSVIFQGRVVDPS